MHQYKGKLIVHTGSMFSGKTSSLEKDINRFSIAKYNTVAFKPIVDTRFSDKNIVTHNNTKIKAVSINNISEILEYCDENKPEVIGIDEAQFLQGSIAEIIDGINSLLKRNITVIVAGLDLDFEGQPFEIMKELMPISDYLYKHHAVCVGCGTDAWVSNRKTSKQERLVLGASDEYEPLCRTCYTKEKIEQEKLVNKNQVHFDI